VAHVCSLFRLGVCSFLLPSLLSLHLWASLIWLTWSEAASSYIYIYPYVLLCYSFLFICVFVSLYRILWCRAWGWRACHVLRPILFFFWPIAFLPVMQLKQFCFRIGFAMQLQFVHSQRMLTWWGFFALFLQFANDEWMEWQTIPSDALYLIFTSVCEWWYYIS
jgi:hypothetical protein